MSWTSQFHERRLAAGRILVGNRGTSLVEFPLLLINA